MKKEKRGGKSVGTKKEEKLVVWGPRPQLIPLNTHLNNILMVVKKI